VSKAPTTQIPHLINLLHGEMTAWRHGAHPELGFEEHHTSEFVAGKIAEFVCEVHCNIGKTGVIGVLRTGNDPSIGVPSQCLPMEGDKALVGNKGFRPFVKSGPDKFSIDYEKAENDAKFDGIFVLRTSTKLSAREVVLRYRNLLAVEDAFRAAKALLVTGPIYHKTDAGIRGHVFCTFLALALRKELCDRLAARRCRGVEWQRIIDDLDDLSEIEVEQDGRRALLRTAPGSTIDPICRALGISLPLVFQELQPA
jgi:hypothetical protein